MSAFPSAAVGVDAAVSSRGEAGLFESPMAESRSFIAAAAAEEEFESSARDDSFVDGGAPVLARLCCFWSLSDGDRERFRFASVGAAFEVEEEPTAIAEG